MMGKHLRLLISASAVVVLLGGSAFAQKTGSEFRRTLVQTSGHAMTIEVSPDTVLCTNVGYGVSFLKVLIPELAPITLLDHQNIGAGAPCVAAGMCGPIGDASPSDILEEDNNEENVEVFIKVYRQDAISHDAQTCTVSLVEQIDVNIRGLAFTHQVSAGLGSRNYQDCLIQ